MSVIDAAVGVRSFGDDGLAITLLSAASEPRHERDAFCALRDIADKLETVPEFRTLVIDAHRVPIIPEEVRGGLLRLFLQFDKRDGTILCAAPDTALAAFERMKLEKLFSQTENLTLLPATANAVAICDDLVAGLDGERLEREQIERAEAFHRRKAPELQCNGNVVFYRLHATTAEVSLNPEILCLDEDSAIAARFRELVSNIAQSEPELERLLLNLRGLEFMGADSIGALITLHNAGKSGKGVRFAVCNLEPALVEKFSNTRLDRFLKVFSSAEAGLLGQW